MSNDEKAKEIIRLTEENRIFNEAYRTLIRLMKNNDTEGIANTLCFISNICDKHEQYEELNNIKIGE